jgi:putative transcriptional regulator
MTEMTQNIKHHLTDALLMGYSAGTLPEAVNLVVATHISMCDTCRAALAEVDAVGGAMLDTAETMNLNKDSLAATLELIANDMPRRDTEMATRNESNVPAPLGEYVKGPLDKLAWRPVGGGVSQLLLPTSKEASVRLLKIPAGTAVPDHGHRGIELTLVLQGAFADEEDEFAVGDIEVANEDLTHTPVAAPGMDCICLAATDAPLKFSGLIPRLAQKFIGI